MNEQVLILSDNRRGIEFAKIMNFYQYQIVDKQSELVLEKKSDLVILDYSDLADNIAVANRIRDRWPSLPLLIIRDYEQPSQYTLFKKIKGYGQLRVFYWRLSYQEKLLEYINNMLHPEYPSGKSDIAIILPVYNEEQRFEHVANFLFKLKSFLEDAFLNTNIYFVNDGSVDNTENLVERIIEKGHQQSDYIYNKAFFTAHELQRNTKKAGTYIEGIKNIDADILLFVDADDSFSIDDIALMINILREGYYDMVVGSKDLSAENRPFSRKVLSFFKRLLTKALLPKGVYDSQTGLKAMKATTARYILPYLKEKRGLAIDLEILYLAKKLKFRVLQIPVKCIDREGSHVNIVKDSLKFIGNIFDIIINSEDIRIERDSLDE